MGEVYPAHDSKLGRDVALKVLPEASARDTQRMARFQREAKVLASLNHPNIASIYGLADSGANPALVMELVEGPTLADRIKQVPIPINHVTGDGKKFVVVSQDPQLGFAPVSLVANWTELLKQK